MRVGLIGIGHSNTRRHRSSKPSAKLSVSSDSGGVQVLITSHRGCSFRYDAPSSQMLLKYTSESCERERFSSIFYSPPRNSFRKDEIFRDLCASSPDFFLSARPPYPQKCQNNRSAVRRQTGRKFSLTDLTPRRLLRNSRHLSESIGFEKQTIKICAFVSFAGHFGTQNNLTSRRIVSVFCVI